MTRVSDKMLLLLVVPAAELIELMGRCSCSPPEDSVSCSPFGGVLYLMMSIMSMMTIVMSMIMMRRRYLPPDSDDDEEV